MSGWADPVLALLALAILAALSVWGLTLQRMTARLERGHPRAFADLRARSRRKAARMAVVSELQGLLSRGEPLPEGAGADPALARLAGRERTARRALTPLILAFFAVYVLA